MYAVMGATGQTGSVVVKELLRRGHPVRALTRNPAAPAATLELGVEAVRADPADAQSLIAAFEGTDAAYVMLPPYTQAADHRATARATSRAIARAIRGSGLRHIVALSSGGAHLAEGTGAILTLHDLEAELRALPVPVTFIRAADFMENWVSAIPVALQDRVVPSGRLPLDAATPTVSTTDIGIVAADCLTERPDGSRIINLMGPKDYAPREIAQAFSAVLGLSLDLVPMTSAELLPALIAGGFGRDYAQGLVEIYEGLNSGLIAFEPGVGETLRGSVRFADALRGMMAR